MSDLPTNLAPKKASSTDDLTPSGLPEKKRRHRWIVWAVLAAVVLGIVYIGYRSRMSSTPSAGAPGSRRGGFGGGFGGMAGPLPVVVKTAQKADINVILDGLGTVTPLATVTVHPQVSGQLTQINYTEGQAVKQGDLLAVIDPRPFQAALEQAEGQLIQAQAQLKEAQIDLDRYVTLSGQDSISKQQVDAQRALASQYEGLAKTDQAAVDNAQLSLAYCHITAPFDGRVGLRLVDQGNYVTPGDATGLVILTKMKPITVIFSLAEDYIPALQKRMREGAAIPVDAYDRANAKKLASGKLASIDNTVDPTTGTFKLRAVFPNDDESLYPNQYVVARMLLNVDHGVTVIPTSSVERGQQGTFVYVVGSDNKVSAKPITLGNAEGERVAVTTGLTIGDKVVVDGADRLKEGMEVVAQTIGQKPAGAGQGAPDGEHKRWKPSGSN
jgi:multidrug efflux system membrane fusion protein